MGRVDLGEVLDGREDMSEATVHVGQWLAVPGHDAGGVGAGRLDRHLLAQHNAERQLGFVDGSRDALAGRLRHQCAEIPIRAQSVDDGLRVRVEVQQPPAAGNRGGQVAEVVQHQRAPDMIGFRCETDDSVPRGNRSVRR